MNFIGKRLKHKTGGNEQTVVAEKEGWLIMDDNSMIKKEKVSESFVESQGQTNTEDFFENSSKTLSNLGDQLINMLNNPQTNITEQPQSQASSIRYIDGVPVTNETFVSGIPQTPEFIDPNSKETKEQILTQRELTPEEAKRMGYSIPTPPTKSVDPWLEEQGFVESDVRKVNTDDFNTDNYKPGIKPSSNESSIEKEKNNPALDLFKSMKKTKKIKIKIEIEDFIPDITSIKHFTTMFDIPVVEHLAKGISEKFLKNPKLLEDLIHTHLNSLINTKPKPRRTIKNNKNLKSGSK
jgi:hypothetical protein